MKFYFNPLSANCRKVSAVIQHLEMEVEEVLIDLAKGENNSPDFLAVNPNGMVPTLVDGDVAMWESHAIMTYLADQAGSEIWPNSSVRYDITRWLSWQLAHLGPACDTLTFQNFLRRAIGMGEPDAEKVAEASKKFERFGAVLNGTLQGKSFICGELTLADFAIASSFTYAEPAQIPVHGFAEIIAWRKRMDELRRGPTPRRRWGDSCLASPRIDDFTATNHGRARRQCALHEVVNGGSTAS